MVQLLSKGPENLTAGDEHNLAALKMVQVNLQLEIKMAQQMSMVQLLSNSTGKLTDGDELSPAVSKGSR